MKRMHTDREIRALASDTAKQIIEAGQTENAKPIYWHSCTLKRISGGSLIYYMDFVIINNDETPFTLDTFNIWLANHPTAEVKTVQGYASANPTSLVSSFKYNAEGEITLTSIKLDDGTALTQNVYSTADSGATFSDNGVNKIN